MAIIRSAIARETRLSTSPGFRMGEVPFVPAWDLYEQQLGQPSAEELAAVALALFSLVSDTVAAPLSPWTAQAKLDSIAQRK